MAGKFNKVKPYKKKLEGECKITLKVDGVRALLNPDWYVGSDLPKYVSRNGKPLYNLNHLDFKDAEIFYKSWEDTITLVRTKAGKPVSEDCVYRIDDIDKRLLLCTIHNPDRFFLEATLIKAVSSGYEGLVIHHESGMYKLKPVESYDVIVTGYQEGTKRNEGRMGALITSKGKVGTGFSDEQRKLFKSMHDKGELIGTTIEVECMSLTKNGKFRHPRYIRTRFDKDGE